MKKIIISFVILLLAFSIEAQTRYVFSGGSGTSSDPYLINSVEDLDSIRHFPNKSFFLLNDLDLASYLEGESGGWTPIGDKDTPFKGTFDGGGRTITGLWIDRTGAYQGLFGYIDTGAKVENLVLKLNASDKTNSISADSIIGGIAGCNAGTISNSLVVESKALKGDSIIGGIAGQNIGIIANCISTITVTATAKGGVLAGELLGTGAFTSSFYAGSTNGSVGNEAADPAGVTNKNLAELKTESTYAAWDFVHTWCIYPDSFPQLRHSLFSSGTGTASSPYTVYSPRELNAINLFFTGDGYSNVYFELGDDMPLGEIEDVTLSSIGTTAKPFIGKFNGNNHSISGLKVPLFGVIGASAVLRHIYIEDCIITVASSVGALAGTSAGKIDSCYVANGTVSGSNAGGLVGVLEESGEVNASFSRAAVTGSTSAGGLVGTSSGSINNCFAEGGVTATGTVAAGGLIGEMTEGSVSNSYSRGLVGGATTAKGGFIGKMTAGDLTASFFLTQDALNGVGDKEEQTGITGKSSADLKVKNTFTGWFIGSSPWNIIDGLSYPYLNNEFIAMDKGTADDPILVNSSNVENIRTYFLGAAYKDVHFKLTGDIVINAGLRAEPNKWTPIGTIELPFEGTFNGDGYMIDGLYIDTTDDYQGFFGVLGTNAKINNLTIRVDSVAGKGAAIKGDQYVGGLVGQNNGTIDSCRVVGTGLIEGANVVGGLAGYNAGVIRACLAVVQVKGTNELASVGGLVGDMSGNIQKSYSAGSVSGYYAGGLVGRQLNGNLNESYSVSFVSGEMAGALIGQYSSGGVTKSYYNTLTSGQEGVAGEGSPGTGVTGLTVAQMLKSESYADWSGWSFKSDTIATYPYLGIQTKLKNEFALSSYAYTYKGTKTSITKMDTTQVVVGADINIALSAKAPEDGHVFVFNPKLMNPETNYLGVYMGISESGIIKPDTVCFSREVDTYSITLKEPNLEDIILLNNNLSFDTPIYVPQTDTVYSFSYKLATGYSNYFVEMTYGTNGKLEASYNDTTKVYTVKIDSLNADMEIAFTLTPGYKVTITKPEGIELTKGSLSNIVKKDADFVFKFEFEEGFSNQTHLVEVKDKERNNIALVWSADDAEYTATMSSIVSDTTAIISLSKRPVVTINPQEGLLLLDGLGTSNIIGSDGSLTIRFKVDAPTYSFNTHNPEVTNNKNESYTVNIAEEDDGTVYSATITGITENLTIRVRMRDISQEEVVNKKVTITLPSAGIELVKGLPSQDTQQYQSFNFTFKLTDAYKKYFVKLYESKKRVPLDPANEDGLYSVTTNVDTDKHFTFELVEPEPEPVEPQIFTVTIHAGKGINLTGNATNKVAERKPFTFSFKVDAEELEGRYLSVVQDSIHHTPILKDSVYSVTISRVTANISVSVNLVDNPVSENKYKVNVRFPLGVTLLSGSNNMEVGDGKSCIFSFKLNEGYENRGVEIKSGDIKLNPTVNSGVYIVVVSQVRANMNITVTLTESRPDSNPEIIDSPVISTEPGSLIIDTQTPTPVYVYDTSGRLKVSRNVTGHEVISLQGGFYIVRCGTLIEKVVIR